MQELKAADIPHVTKDGITAIVIAGEALGVKVVMDCVCIHAIVCMHARVPDWCFIDQSPVYTLTPVHYLHFFMKPGSALHQPVWCSL